MAQKIVDVPLPFQETTVLYRQKMATYGLHSAFQCQPSDPPRVTAKGGGRKRIKGIVCFEPHFRGCSLEFCIGFKEGVVFVSTDFAGTS